MEIVDIQFTGNQDRYQQYEPRDLSLLNTVTIAPPFGSDQDYVEYFIYDANGTLLESNYFVNSYSPINPDPVTGTYTSIQVDPEGDIRAEGYTRGTVSISYNFFRKLFNSDVTKIFWIKEISGDRTELRVCRQDLSNLELQQAFTDYNNLTSLKAYYPDFYLNFGDDNIIIGVNVLYALQNEEGCLLIKLYEPLPDSIGLKDTFWIVDKLSDSANFDISIEVPAEVVVETDTLRGPNFTVEVLEKVGQTTPLYNYSSLLGTSLSASYQQLKSLMDEKGLDINVDYTNFSNFVHFSSATERIYNFAYKVQQIENYTNDITTLDSINSGTSIASGSKQILQNNINTIIEKFDGYEYYLYFTSASDAWPKSTSIPPYTLYPVTSSQVINWLGGPNIEPYVGTYSILYSASVYDNLNPDGLVNTVPNYLKNDTNNTPYLTFLNMVGQHFDNIWIYLKDVTERYDAENNLDKGISKDLVGDALRALGIKLYTNTSISDNIYYSLLAINPDGSLTPPTGSETISTYIPFAANGKYVIPKYVGTVNNTAYSASLPIAGDDITKEYYKRLYHNVPYLLKTRGTARGLRALINCFGIPDTILRINEFGGADKLEATADLIQTRHSLAYYNSGSANLDLPWMGLEYYYLSTNDSEIFPDTIEFRFKSTGIPEQTHVTQSILERNIDSTTYPFIVLNLTYNTSSAIPTSSYQYYGDLRLHMYNGDGVTDYATTPAMSLPFYDPSLWWNVMIKRDLGQGQAQSNTTSNTYWVYAKGTAYDEEGNATIAYQASQSIYADGGTAEGENINNDWNYSNLSYTYTMRLGGYVDANPAHYFGEPFQGYFQEFRYWATPLSESAFNEHVINSTSYRGNDITSSLFDLAFRLPLGSNLNIPYIDSGSIEVNAKDYDLYELGITSISSSAVLTSYHPAITGTFILPFDGSVVNSVPSFINLAVPATYSYGLFSANNPRYFQPFNIVDLIPTPSTGIGQKVNNKITIATEDNLAEDLLSPFVSIQKYNENISKNSTDIEVGFAPSDVLDLDISNQLGYFNIDEYIGNPSDAYSSSYQSLDNLRATYFEKYTSKYNVEDFIRLIKYYDNSLFKMIKDFVPARANLSTGIIVKPHILERPKYPRNEPIVTNEANWSGSIRLGTISGSNPEDIPTTLLPCRKYTVTDNGLGGSVLYSPCTPPGPLQTIVLNPATYLTVTFYTKPDTSVQSFGDVIVDDKGDTSEQTYYQTALNTSYTKYITTPLGTITSSQTDLSQPFTGDFGGNEIEGASNYFPQTEVSSIIAPWTSSIQGGNKIYTTYSIDPLQNNALTDDTSTYRLKVDYSSNPNVPVNLGLITGALALYPTRTESPGSSVLSSQYWPFAEVNDYNWESFARVSPRYLGAEMVGLQYNTYSAASQTWQGDQSYGKTAVIDKIKYQYAYLVDIYTASIALPGRVNAQIKYLIDNRENTLNLTKANNYVFDVQNIFKSGETGQVSLFDYNPSNPDVQSLTNNKTLQIYEGGFRYSPILYNITGSSQLIYTYVSPFVSSSTVAAPVGGTIYAPTANFWLNVDPTSDQIPGTETYTLYRPGNTTASFHMTGSTVYGLNGVLTSGSYTTTTQTSFTWTLRNLTRTAADATITFTIPSGVTPPYKWIQSASNFPTNWRSGDTYSVYSINPAQTTVAMSGTTTLTQYYITASDTQPKWYAVDNRTVKMSSVQSQEQVYGDAIQTFTGSISPAYPGVDTPVFPIELTSNDIVKFYSTSSQWAEQEEYRVVSAQSQFDSTGSFIYITLDRDLNPAVTDTGTIPSAISRYIALKHVPDETNLILRYTPSAPILQDGLILPQYIDPVVQANAGNVVQSLKANNLI